MKVRIAVAVDENGAWGAWGWDDGGEEKEGESGIQQGAIGSLPSDGPHPLRHHVVWVTADVPLPAAVAVEGEVEDE